MKKKLIYILPLTTIFFVTQRWLHFNGLSVFQGLNNVIEIPIISICLLSAIYYLIKHKTKLQHNKKEFLRDQIILLSGWIAIDLYNDRFSENVSRMINFYLEPIIVIFVIISIIKYILKK